MKQRSQSPGSVERASREEIELEHACVTCAIREDVAAFIEDGLRGRPHLSMAASSHRREGMEQLRRRVGDVGVPIDHASGRQERAFLAHMGLARELGKRRINAAGSISPQQ